MVSITYVNWNTMDWIDKSIKKILEHPPKVEYEIIIVDNGSTIDNYKQWKEEHPQYKYIENPKNMGAGYAINQAILASRGKYFCFINPDTEPKEGWLDILVAYLEEHPECGLVAPSGTNVCNPNMAPQNNKGENINSTGSVVPFMCIVVPKIIFCNHGLLAMNYGEDIEFARRLQAFGKTSVIVAKAFVLHSSNSSFLANKIGRNSKVIQDYFRDNVLPLISEDR